MTHNKPTKIGIVYSGAKHSGGIETYLELLFENIDRDKVDLTLLSLGKWPLTEKVQSRKFKVEIFSGSRISPSNIYRIASYLRKGHFDLVVSQGVVANVYARKASFFSGVPSLVTVHSDIHYDYPNPIFRTIYAIVDRLTRFQTKQYIAVSEYLKEKAVVSGIAASKISVILNGVNDPGLDSRLRGNDKSELVVIGSIGRLHKVKNYAELIRACSKLQITNYKLLIIGEGSERQNLENLIAEIDLGDKVELVGNVDDVSKYLSQIDIYVQPSLSEGFGLTVVEAMLAGKPVIVSPYGALPELVGDEKTGIIMKGTSAADIARSINELVADKKLSDKVSLAGQEYAREAFAVEKWVGETEKTYTEAAK